jgi:hypothetical protein
MSRIRTSPPRSSWLRETGAEQQPQARLLRRGSTAIDERQRRFELRDAPRALVALGKLHDVLDGERCRAHEGVEARNRLATLEIPVEIERRTRRCGHWKVPNPRQFIVADALIADDDATRRPSAVLQQFNRDVVVHPFRTMQGRRRKASDDPVAFRPQPSTDGPVPMRHVAIPRHMHVWIDRSIPPLKFMSRHDTAGDCLSADKDLPHGRILVATTDKPAKLYSSRPSLEVVLLEYRFDGRD